MLIARLQRTVIIAGLAFVLSAVLGLSALGTEDARAQTPGQLTYSIDANPTNGTRPCSPIDSTASVALNASHTVAVCLSNYSGQDANVGALGSPQAFEARVLYSTLDTAPEIANVSPALNDNPDFNDAAGPNGNGSSGWDCSVALAGIFPYGNDPVTPERDAFIFCLNAASSGALTADPGLLATITFNAGGTSGQEALTFSQTSNIYNFNCGISAEIACVGATITKGQAGPTNTPGPSPTSTNTPTATATSTCGGAGQSTCTPVATSTRNPITATPTRTAIPTGSATSAPPPGETPGSSGGGGGEGGGAAPTETGGAPGGTITPPNTGDGSADTSGLMSRSVVAAIVLGVVGVALAGTAVVTARRRRI